MLPESFEPPPPAVTSIPAADVHAPTGNGEETVQQSFPVRKPEADRNEFLIQVRASTLLRCRRRLQQLATNSFPWPEVALGISSLTLGAFLSAITSGVALDSKLGIAFYAVLPAIGVGAAVAFCFLRVRATVDTASVCSEVLSELPDPDQTR